MSEVVCGISHLGIDSIAQQYADSGYQRTDFHLAKFTRMTPDTQIFIILVHSKGFPHRILKTGNEKRETENWKPETANWKRETENRKPETANWKRETENGKLKTGNRKLETGN